MKSAILVVVFAAGVGVFASSSYAQERKALPLHPAAAADPSLQKSKVNLPSKKAAIPGEPGATVVNPGAAVVNPGAAVVKPDTGEAVPSGGTTTVLSQPN